MSILEMAEHLKVPLYPVQKFVLKLIYRIPLDSKTEQIIVRNPFDKKPTLLLTEVDYLGYLQEQDRCHLPPTASNTFVLAAGRRGGKTHLSCLVAAYESLSNTKYESMNPNNIWVFSTDKDQAQAALQHCNHMLKSQGVKVFSSGGQVVVDKSKVFFRGSSSYAKAFRGIESRVLIFDEAAYSQQFQNVYNNTIPSLITHSDSRILVTSSPSDEPLPYSEGTFFKELYHSGVPSLQIPTWELNPTIPDAMFLEQRHRNDYEAVV